MSDTLGSAPSASHLHELFMQAPMPIAITAGPKHIYDVTNDHYRTLILGKNVVGMRVAEVVPKAQREDTIGLMDRVYRTGKPYFATEYHVRLLGKNKTPKDRYFNFTFQPVRNGSKKVSGIMQVGYEVTEQIEARDRLQKSQERLQLALKAGNMGVWDWDIAGKRIKWSEKVYELLGIKPSEFDGSVEEFGKNGTPLRCKRFDQYHAERSL